MPPTQLVGFKKNCKATKVIQIWVKGHNVRHVLSAEDLCVTLIIHGSYTDAIPYLFA